MGKKDKKKAAPVEASRNRPRLKTRKRPPGSQKEAPKEIAVFDPDNVERVLDAMPPQDAVARAADRLQGLAHPSRIQALMALATSELCVGDMAAVLGLSLSATSTMLKQLRSLGFLATRQAGKQIYYRTASPAPKAVLDVVFRLDQTTP